jgi:hypothetical protein
MGIAMEDLHMFILIVVCSKFFDSITGDWVGCVSSQGLVNLFS